MAGFRVLRASIKAFPLPRSTFTGRHVSRARARSHTAVPAAGSRSRSRSRSPQRQLQCRDSTCNRLKFQVLVHWPMDQPDPKYEFLCETCGTTRWGAEWDVVYSVMNAPPRSADYISVNQPCNQDIGKGKKGVKGVKGDGKGLAKAESIVTGKKGVKGVKGVKGKGRKA